MEFSLETLSATKLHQTYHITPNTSKNQQKFRSGFWGKFNCF